MKYQQQAEHILRSYNNRVAWGEDTDREAALQDAINSAYPMRTDEEKADLYAKLMENWDEYPAGTGRLLYVVSTITKWNNYYLYSNPAKVVHGVQAPKQEEDDES